MSNPAQQMNAAALLKKEKDMAEARAVLNRPTSAVPVFLTAMTITGLGVFLQAVEKFEAPMWVTVFLITGVSGSVLSMMDSWTTRRRLDAALLLLELQQGSDR